MRMIAEGEFLTFVFLGAVGLLIIMIFVTVKGGPRSEKRRWHKKGHTQDNTPGGWDSLSGMSGRRRREDDRHSSGGDDSGGSDDGGGGDGGD